MGYINLIFYQDFLKTPFWIFVGILFRLPGSLSAQFATDEDKVPGEPFRVKRLSLPLSRRPRLCWTA
jgi:hypothetical protein